MNRSTSLPSNDFADTFDDKDGWLYKNAENQQIQKFKVILRNLPHSQNKQTHKRSNRTHYNHRHAVQSLSNLECIVENEKEESNVVSSLDDIDNLEYIDSVDSLDDEHLNEGDKVDYVKQAYIKADQFYELEMPTTANHKSTAKNASNNVLINKDSIATIAEIAAQQQQQLINSDRSNDTKHATNHIKISSYDSQIQSHSSNPKSSNLHKTTSSTTTKTKAATKAKRSNYQSNLNNFTTQTNKSNYKQINTDNDNFFFGPATDQKNEERRLREIASRNRKITRRQNICDYLTLFLISTAFISIFVAVILLFLIALDAWSMQLAFTITLIILCILTVLLVLFASFTANFVFFYNTSSNSIDWMVHYGRRKSGSDYYFGKSLKVNRDEENNNDIE